jgi:putative ABC transport system permease protein
MHVEDNLRAGMTPEEAHRAALIALGGMEQTKEKYRDGRGIGWIERLGQDVRFSARVLRKSPGFTAIAVLTLAVGIGANTAVFSLANAAFFRPFPFAHAERLAFLWQENTRTGEAEGNVSYPNYSDWRAESHSFEDMAFINFAQQVMSRTPTPDTQNGPTALQHSGALVSTNFFTVMGVSPMFGRAFLPDESTPGRANVAVISYGLWQSQFGGDPNVLGRKLYIGDTVIGVMPPNFSFPGGVKVWVPREISSFLQTKARQYPQVGVIGRLRSGVNWHQAQSEMDTIAGRLAAQYPEANGGVGIRIVPLREQLSEKVRRGLVLLWCAIFGVLLIACLNTANLILVRAVGRQKEIAVRFSLGATRVRIARQFLAESALLSTCGAALGVLLAAGVVRLVSGLDPDIAKLSGSVLDVRVLGYTIIVSVLTALICGLLPVLSASRLDLSRSLKETNAASGKRGQAIRRALTIAEISLAFVVLVGSGLLIRSVWRVLSVNPGFDAERSIVFRVDWRAGTGITPKQRDAGYEVLIRRLQALPGVTLGSTSNALFPDEMYKAPFVIEGRPGSAPSEQPLLLGGDATPQLFQAMGIPLLRGREFTDADVAAEAAPVSAATLGTTQVAIVNEAMAKRYWPGEDAIGKRFKMNDPNFKSPWFSIIGVVGDVRQDGLEAPAPPMAYFPDTFSFGDEVVIRTLDDPDQLITVLRETASEVNENFAIMDPERASEILSAHESDRKFNALLLSAFGFVGLFLAALGIYGTTSYWVKDRTREIGIQMALGAQPEDVFGEVLRRGMTGAVVGLAIGVCGALAVTRLMRALLFEINPFDSVTLVAVAAMLLFVVLAACFVPARRAMRVDPMVALRHE